MDKNPLISVIVPAYNASEYIVDTIKTISNQTYNNIEIIIVNDGSTDDTELVVKGMIDSDNRIKLITIENGGVGHARNIGVESANGTYIRFCDADDFYPKNSTKILIESILRHDADIAMGPLHLLFDNKSHRIPNPHKKIYKKDEFLETNPINNISLGENAQVCNKIYKKSFLIENKIVSPRNLIAQDVVFSFHCYMVATKIAILSIDEIVYFWKVRYGSLSRSGPTDKYTSDRIKIAHLIENKIEYIGKNGFLIEKIRNRNINSILNLVMERDKFLTKNQFNEYKRFLNRLISKKFNLPFHLNTDFDFILLAIINKNYIEANKIYYVLLSSKLSLQTDTEAICNTLGNFIKFPLDDKDYFSNWTNRDLVLFHIKPSIKGLYKISILYAWNSNKTDNNIRKGVLIANNKKYVVLFTRTKTWSSFKRIEVVIDVQDVNEKLCILKPVNEKGIGFINLKSIHYNIITTPLPKQNRYKRFTFKNIFKRIYRIFSILFNSRYIFKSRV